MQHFVLKMKFASKYEGFFNHFTSRCSGNIDFLNNWFQSHANYLQSILTHVLTCLNSICIALASNNFLLLALTSTCKCSDSYLISYMVSIQVFLNLLSYELFCTDILTYYYYYLPTLYALWAYLYLIFILSWTCPRAFHIILAFFLEVNAYDPP